MAYEIVAVVVLGIMVMPAAACVAIIPWRFEFGKSWRPLPLKLIYPAVVLPLAVLAFAVAIGGGVLALAVSDSPAIRSLSMAEALAAAVAGVAHAGYIRRVTRAHVGFEAAFGPNWRDRIGSVSGMLSRRWSPFRYRSGTAQVQRDVAIRTVEEAGGPLLADVWRPSGDTQTTGVAFLYLHGSAWHFFDKGIGTDPMFRHLAAQGHVVLDVAYRLAPETDIAGMTADAKRAVAWAKRNADRLGIDPNKIVAGGASAGGHVAMLAAYGHRDPAFTPEDLHGLDTSVAGVVSLYAPSDLRAFVDHHAGRLAITGKPAKEKAPIRFDAMNTEQMMMNLCGGMPHDVPHRYDLADVKSHVAEGAPPALIFQGEADFIAPKAATLQLVDRLKLASVPVVYVEFRQTEHVWDVMTSMAKRSFGRSLLPGFLDSQYAPQTQAMLYDIERFLAYLASSADIGKKGIRADSVV